MSCTMDYRSIGTGVEGDVQYCELQVDRHWSGG